MFGGGAGGVNMRESHIYIKKHLENENITLSRGGGGIVSQIFTPP